MPQLVWCLRLITMTMPHQYCATFIGCQWDSKLSSKLLSSFGSVSMALLQCSLPARAMHSSGQHPWSSQTTVCFNWLHLATKSANVCCTTKLCLQWAGRVEQSASNTARQQRVTVTTHIQAETDNVLICSMMNTIRHCCGVFVNLALLHKALNILTYLKSFFSRTTSVSRYEKR